MSHYQPYPAYKDSGVEWLGKVPEHWIVGKVKWEFDAQLGKMLQPEKKHKSDIQVPYHKAVSVQWENIANEPPEIMWASPDEAEKYQLQKDDLLICEGGDVGRAGIFENDDGLPVIIQNSVHRVRPLHENSNKTLLRIMQICRSSGWFDVLCSKATIVHFTSEKLGDLAFPIAPPDEQQAIAKHLDRETARIDSLITKKIRFIELLKEKRQALITQAVTKGLDPHVKMKDSGVEWLGEVPEQWEVKPIKLIANVGNGSTPNRDNINYWNDGIFPWLNSAFVNMEGVFESNEYVSSLALKECHLPIIKPPAVLIGLTGQGKTRGLATTLHIEATINQHVAYIKPIENELSIDFLRRFIDAAYIYLRDESGGGGSTKGAITCEQLKSLKIPIPPIEEQNYLMQFLAKSNLQISDLIAKSEKSIILLKERRSALITAAVTGQIDLREAA